MNETAGSGGWFKRLRQGLAKSSTRLGDGINAIFTKEKLDEEDLDALEELFITADLGVRAAGEIRDRLAAQRFEKDLTPDGVKAAVAQFIASTLEPVAQELALDPAHKPHVVLVVGVNGTGKTTTIGKLAHRFAQEGKKVVLAAGDTFRAAAIEQLEVWGQRAGATVVTSKVGGDAAGLAYDALKQAKDEGADVLMIDTAGRLQNKADLMAELEKIRRVVAKLDADAPHDVLLVLDATTGQNALSQIEIFEKTAGVTGLVMTKLDGTARGGVLVAAAERFKLPIVAIGVGEKIDDLRPFAAGDFARALVGI